ncbi:MAG: hypothetical protein JWM27_68 [Gemmatimonadetes bacterium]|nr:hypothetical protein [Gemmatimonadota bacterium]
MSFVRDTASKVLRAGTPSRMIEGAAAKATPRRRISTGPRPPILPAPAPQLFAAPGPRRIPSFALLCTGEGPRLVLEEAPAAVALACWQLAQDAATYATADPDARPVLFASPPLWPLDAPDWTAPAHAIAAGIATQDGAAVAAAAGLLSERAEAHGLFATAVVMAEVAALLTPEDAVRALRVATLARDRGHHVAAEWWGLRAAARARRCGDWLTTVHGYARAADAMQARGAYTTAARVRRREFAAARRTGSPTVLARAAHSRFVAAVFVRDWTAADRWAGLALRLYSAGDARLPALAHDVAWLAIQRGRFASALPVLRSLLAVSFEPADRLRLAVNVARAAAPLRLRAEYERAVREAFAALDSLAYGGEAASALAALAEAACLEGETSSARLWAGQALTLATARGDAESKATARAVLGRLD